ncbi:hypothetical protein BSKO_00108 [Bryopsis sp. KO-2023]|nr:hypothetical protein BSKO_00108 [Bryopsis sp. KO-2023]
MERDDSRCEERVKINRFLAGCNELGATTLPPENQTIAQCIQRLERTTTAFEEAGPSKEFSNVSTKWGINDRSAGSSLDISEGRVVFDQLRPSERAHYKATQTLGDLKEQCCTPASSGTGQTDGFRTFSGRDGQHEESPAISSSFQTSTHQATVSRDPRRPPATTNEFQQRFDQNYFDPRLSAFSSDEALAASALMELSRDSSWSKPETTQCQPRVSFDEVKKLLHLPIREAALVLRVAVPEIKRLCEENGIQQWLTIKTKSMKQLLKDFPGTHHRGARWSKTKRSRLNTTKRRASKDAAQKRDAKEELCCNKAETERKRVQRRANRNRAAGGDDKPTIETARSMELQTHDSAQTVDRQNSGPSIGVIQEGITN